MSEQTDEEAFEEVKERTLAMLKRAADALERGATFDETMECGKEGMSEVVERVAMIDLKELGRVAYEQNGRRWVQWVYRHRRIPDRVYCIGWQHRLLLQQVGYTMMTAYVSDPGVMS